MRKSKGQGRKTKEGVVVSNKMNKTAVVLVERTFPHPSFRKVITRGKKYYAHVDKFDLVVGQKVRIMECRPFSKLKHWLVVDVLSQPSVTV